MAIFTLTLAVLAVLVVVAAEWSRISARFGSDARTSRSRQRRKERLTVIDGAADDEFAASVERDLANLPVTEERDGRTRR